MELLKLQATGVEQGDAEAHKGGSGDHTGGDHAVSGLVRVSEGTKVQGREGEEATGGGGHQPDAGGRILLFAAGAVTRVGNLGQRRVLAPCVQHHGAWHRSYY